MSNSLKNNTLYCFIILSISAALSACGGSSSSTPTTTPNYSSVYYVHNLVFKNGTTLSTGYNAFGQLGTGNLGNRSVPGTLSQYYPFRGFAIGGDHSVAFTDIGDVYSWGYNAYGQLGNNTTTYSSVPVKISPLETTIIPKAKAVAVAAGAFHTLALTEKGRVWAWGWNSYGQLGYLTISGFSAIPLPIDDGASGVAFPKVIAIAANGYNSMALAEDPSAVNPLAAKKVWVWGSNLSGQLGPNGGSFGASPIPVTVPIPSVDVTGIAAGSAFSYALASDTTVWAWGNNSNGQLGNGTILADANIPGSCVTAVIPSSIPVQVETALNTPLTGVVQVAAGYHHGLARLSDGSVWAWGANLFGQLGTSQVVGNSCFAVRVELKDASGNYLNADDIRAFGSSSMAKVGSAWYVWGNNIYGQLGVGSSGLNSTVPLPIKMSGF